MFIILNSNTINIINILIHNTIIEPIKRNGIPINTIDNVNINIAIVVVNHNRIINIHNNITSIAIAFVIRVRMVIHNNGIRIIDNRMITIICIYIVHRRLCIVITDIMRMRIIIVVRIAVVAVAIIIAIPCKASAGDLFFIFHNIDRGFVRLMI